MNVIVCVSSYERVRLASSHELTDYRSARSRQTASFATGSGPGPGPFHLLFVITYHIRS